MAGLTLQVLPARLAIARLPVEQSIPDWATGPLVSVTRTVSELSVVCDERAVPDTVAAERGWSVIGVTGTLDFSETGILAALTTPLARAQIPLFALSTFDTDYILVRHEQLVPAIAALRAAGFGFTAESFATNG